MKLLKTCDKIIEYSFYALFFLVPLIFTSNTSELFEFNKMWLTFFLTIVIASFWFIKMLVSKTINFRKTPFDLPLGLFLVSQVISTVFSLDSYVSFWGYYSRFNGGLLSHVTYIFLFYALISNLEKENVKKLITISFVSGVFVVLWGIPSHFGLDPTCLLFRGTFDVSCWTEAFKPTIRIFSTLGQPAWLASFLAFLTPVALSQVIKNYQKNNLKSFALLFYFLLTVLFYLALIFTNTKAGFIAFWLVFFVFLFFGFRKKILPGKKLLTFSVTFLSLFLLLNFIFGTPFPSLDKYQASNLLSQATRSKPTPTPTKAKNAPSATELGGTDSGKIRLYVWQGAIKAWQAYPLFGTGVETFAFAYYKYRPPGHNLTSEWDYLYNKAHNEYLNYLTTTGAFGLLTYLFFIISFIIYFSKRFVKEETSLLETGLFTGWLSILIANFFGFSVVIINLYFFLTPVFLFVMSKNAPVTFKSRSLSPVSHLGIIFILASALTASVILYRYYKADTLYALGHNLDGIGEYQRALPDLTNAVKLRPKEPVFQSELAVNNAILAQIFATQKYATDSALLANQAVAISNEVVQNHPNNIVFWKDRVRLFYTLARINPAFLKTALASIQKATTLAPTDAKVWYNYGVLTGQTGNITRSIQILQKTVQLKPDYPDAYFALGLFYHEKGVKDKNNDYLIKAVNSLQTVLRLAPGNKQAQELLKSWGAK